MIEVYFDGSYLYQYKKGYAAFIIKTSTKIIRRCAQVKSTDHNHCEEVALRLAIKELNKLSSLNQIIHIKGDSQSIIIKYNTAIKNKRPNSPKYKSLKHEFSNIIFNLIGNNFVIVSWIPRKQNLADSVTKYKCDYFQETRIIPPQKSITKSITKTIDKQLQLV
jgi:ribonuclease HI